MGLADDLSLERAAFDIEREGFDLFRAACLFPRIARRNAAVHDCVDVVERWGATLRSRARGMNEDEKVRALVEMLFHELGFRGDVEEYDAPQNSFLVDVIERRRGLPIALSLLTVAVAEAAGLTAFGVALPRHYVVGVGGEQGFVLLDPFHKGRSLDTADIEKLTGMQGLDVVGHAVTQTSPRSTLMRMLANLHGSYLRRGEREPLVRVLSRMMLFEPRHPALLVQRAQVRSELGELDEAIEDARQSLTLTPDDDTRRAGEETVRRLEETRRFLH
jgi:regulator of sirC expression with transglutaminase-like and TPR domain